jgi:hypothetical protein
MRFLAAVAEYRMAAHKRIEVIGENRWRQYNDIKCENKRPENLETETRNPILLYEQVLHAWSYSS